MTPSPHLKPGVPAPIWALAALAAAACIRPATAQDPATEYRLLPVRVVAGAAPGATLIDRGALDKVQVGDSVLIKPRRGGVIRGTVIRVDERTSLVELDLRQAEPLPGTPGEMRVPMSRYPVQPGQNPVPDRGDRPIKVPDRERALDEPEPTEPTEPGTDGERKPPSGMPPVRWQNKDRNFRLGQPLLVEATRPEERKMRVSGRVYGIVNLTRHFETDYEQSFGRVGVGLDVDNPAGLGGRFESLVETNYRREFDEDEGTNLLVRRLSYTYGGTRFNRNRVQVGRFLQYGFPEFSTIDGIEYSRRTFANTEVGISAGFLPVPDESFNDFDDFQASGWVLWKANQQESTTLGVGYQLVLHEGETDRNLIVLKGDSRPNDDWLLSARVHVDLQDANDQFRNDPFLISQVVAQATRTWDEGHLLRFGYRRLALPELQRFEFIQPLQQFNGVLVPNGLADDHYDRVFVEGSRFTDEKTRWHTYGAVFTDENFTGGNLELGVDLIDRWGSNSNLDLVVFGVYGDYVTVVGGRINWRKRDSSGAFNVFYEIANHDERQFVPDIANILQHRLRVSRSWYSLGGWDAEISAEAQVIGADIAWIAGLYFQRRF